MQWTIIYLGRQLLDVSSSLPESQRFEPNRANRHALRSLLFGLAPSGVYLAKRVTSSAGELLPHRFTLTERRNPSPGGLLSAALALVSRPVGVTDHSALWSPDFPLVPNPAPAIVWFTSRKIMIATNASGSQQVASSTSWIGCLVSCRQA